MGRINFRRVAGAGGIFTLAGCLWAVVLFIVILVCIGGIFAIVFGALRSSEPFKQAVAEVQSNPQAVRALGEPVEVGWFVGGSINIQGDSGNADLTIPVSGSVDKGTLYVTAYKSGGIWRFTRMELVTKKYPDRINLLGE
ncbi:MAG: cytochrome c oxidase assembly factor Coa1 family protein [Anaerolineae bacterium]|jgi:hypothetical protein|nr:cytochrome c oxidase assembly factor Coa1 family protein [Anaerolineae bacterium]